MHTASHGGHSPGQGFHRLALLLAAIVAALSAASPASAQIYSWRDANGTLVLSDRPQGAPESAAPRLMSPVTGPEAVATTGRAVPERAARYEALIEEHARRNNIRPDLVRAVIQVESAFDATAVSPKGAMGLMQLMPATAESLGVGNPFNPQENVRAGVTYLRQLLDRYDNDEEVALAAYNAGPGAVDRHGQSVPPYRETIDYVSKVNEMAGRKVRVPGTRIYRTVEIIDGREVVRYSDRP